MVAVAGQQGAAQQLQAGMHRAAQGGILQQLQALVGQVEGALAFAEHGQQVDMVDAEQGFEQHVAAQPGQAQAFAAVLLGAGQVQFGHGLLGQGLMAEDVLRPGRLVQHVQRFQTVLAGAGQAALALQHALYRLVLGDQLLLAAHRAAAGSGSVRRRRHPPRPAGRR